MTIGERIKQRRTELNMSQDELGKKVGYKSRSSIQKIENARNLPLPKVEKMAVALDCTPSYLMGWETEPATIPDDTVKAKRIREIYKMIPEDYLDDPEFVKQIMQVVNEYSLTDPSNPDKEIYLESIKTYRDIQQLSPEKRSQLETYLRFLQSDS